MTQRRKTQVASRGVKICVLCLVSCVLIFDGCSPKVNQVCFSQSCVNVEIVKKPEELSRGLQFRKSLEKNSGMLFIFPQAGVYQFWMKDTLIPLDMLWLNEEREIVHIARQVPPCVEDPCPTYGPEEPSRYVLEVNADHTDVLGLKVGDQAAFRFNHEK